MDLFHPQWRRTLLLVSLGTSMVGTDEEFISDEALKGAV